MSANKQHPDTRPRPEPARQPSLGQLAEPSDQDDRAAMEDDRRRQGELDYGELGGEA